MRRAAGFTLLEMLLAISLMLMLAGLAYGTLRIGVRGWEAADDHAERGDALHVAWPFLHQTLEDARLYSGRDATHPSFIGTEQDLRWVSQLPAHFAQGGPRVLQLSVEQDHAHDRRQLVLRNYSLDAESDAATASGTERDDTRQRAVLVDDLATLKIAYYGVPQSETRGAPLWQDSWQQRDVLPLLVRVDITPQDAEPWPSLYAHPYLAASPSSEQLDTDQPPDGERNE